MSVFASPPYVSPRPGLCGMRSASAKLLINFKYPKLFSFSSSVSVICTHLCLTTLWSLASLSHAPHAFVYEDFMVIRYRFHVLRTVVTKNLNLKDSLIPYPSQNSLSSLNSLSKKNELQPKAAAHPYIYEYLSITR